MAIDPINKSQETNPTHNKKLPDQAERNPQKSKDDNPSDSNDSNKSGGITKDKDGNYTGADVNV